MNGKYNRKTRNFTYDEQTALSAFMFDDPKEYLGMTWEELITCWKDDVNTRLAWVGQ